MEAVFENKKLELHYESVGENTARKQTLNNVKESTTAEEMAKFGALMGQLAPEDEGIDSLVVVERQRISL